MKVIARTDEYTIYQKRSERFAVKDKSRQWVRGDAKVSILLTHDLIKAPPPKAPEPEEPAAEAAAEESPAEDDAAAGEAEGEDKA